LSVTIIVAALATLGIAFAVVVAVLIKKNRVYFKYQAPHFCYLILAGAIIGYISVFLSLPQPLTPLCTAMPWLWGVSFMLVFGGLFAKVFRMWRIGSAARKLKRLIVTEGEILKPVSGLIVVDLAFLSIWTAIDMPKAISVSFNNEVWSTCSSTAIYWWIIFLCYKILFLVFGVFLAVEVRNFDSAINESRQVALSLYVMLLDVCVMAPIGYTLRHIPLVTFIVFAFGITIPYLAVTAILFMPNTLKILRHEPPPEVKKKGSLSSIKIHSPTVSQSESSVPETTQGSNSPVAVGESPSVVVRDNGNRKSIETKTTLTYSNSDTLANMSSSSEAEIDE